MYDIIDPSIRDEIIEGAHGSKHDDLQEAVSFLEQISDLLAQFITIIRNFFRDLQDAINNH